MSEEKRGPGRRALLLAAPALLGTAALGTVALGPAGGLVSLDWGLSETLFALGLPVMAAADTPGYARVMRDPPTPPGVRNLGLWSAPNLELLQALSPSLMLIQNWQAPLLPLLRRIGPVEMLSLYTRTGSPYEHALAATRQIADRQDARPRAERFIAAGEARLAQARTQLRSAAAGRAVLVVKPLASASFMAFGQSSLFQGALDRLGLINAWQQPSMLLAGASIIDIATLARQSGDAWVIMIGSADPGADQPLQTSHLWRSLPFVQARRLVPIAPLWEFGALPTAFRFGQDVSAALQREARA